MLKTDYVKAALRSNSRAEHAAGCYDRRAQILMSFRANQEPKPPITIYEKVVNLRERAANMRLLKNLTDTAVSLLTKEQQEVVRLRYLKGRCSERVAKELGLCKTDYYGLHRNAIARLGILLHCLGLTDERFLTLFNDEYTVVEMLCSVIAERAAQKERRSNSVATDTKIIKILDKTEEVDDGRVLSFAS